MTEDEMKNRISMALKDQILQQGFEIICKNLSELEKRLSVLLSCKNCPDNKGGFICQKEYEDKCLTQKIQYIKELKEENTELEKENAELKECLTVGTNWNKGLNSMNKSLEEERDKYRNMVFDQKEQLRKAEDIIRSLYFIIQGRIDYEGNIPLEDEMYRAKQFLKEVSE